MIYFTMDVLMLIIYAVNMYQSRSSKDLGAK